jgi:hypothetical protein
MRENMTPGELTFKSFCDCYGIPCERVDEGPTATPDYRIEIGSVATYVEIKDIKEDENFGTPVHKRIVGAHVRSKIEEARSQLQPPARFGAPTLLLIYNALDPFQAFGTEQHDFLAGMYGELTARIDLQTNKIAHFFRGRNKSFGTNKNTSFSAVGGLYSRSGKLTITLYENVFAKNPVDFESLPSCFEFHRIVIEEE